MPIRPETGLSMGCVALTVLKLDWACIGTRQHVVGHEDFVSKPYCALEANWGSKARTHDGQGCIVVRWGQRFRCLPQALI